MRCPFCDHSELKVTDSRDTSEISAIRRRRECLRCLKRFTTFETIELTVQVKKRDGTYEDFQQQKLLNGLLAACHRTKISREQVLALASKITSQLLQNQSKEIQTLEIGDRVMSCLKELDEIAYIRFACVYSRFQDLTDLEDAIKRIHSKG